MGLDHVSRSVITEFGFGAFGIDGRPLKDRLDLGGNRNRRLTVSTCMEVALSDGFTMGNKALHSHPDVLVE